MPKLLYFDPESVQNNNNNNSITLKRYIFKMLWIIFEVRNKTDTSAVQYCINNHNFCLKISSFVYVFVSRCVLCEKRETLFGGFQFQNEASKTG